MSLPRQAPPPVSIEYYELGGLSYALKGLFDRVVAAIAIVVLAIPMAIVIVAIKVTSPGPSIIKQERVGRFGRPFMFYKFRSMRADAEFMRDELEEDNDHDIDTPLIFKMRHDPRVTRWAHFFDAQAWMNCRTSSTSSRAR